MTQAEAVKILRKLWGHRVAWRDTGTRTSEDAREAARAELARLRPLRDEAAARATKRLNELINADPEYLAAVHARDEAREAIKRAEGVALTYRLVVGQANEMFFHVKAEGDHWQDVVDRARRQQQKEQAS